MARVVWEPNPKIVRKGELIEDGLQMGFHIPDEIWEMSCEHEVFVKDSQTGELYQVLDLCEK